MSIVCDITKCKEIAESIRAQKLEDSLKSYGGAYTLMDDDHTAERQTIIDTSSTHATNIQNASTSSEVLEIINQLNS